VRALSGDQASELAAAGHQHQATRAAWYQRPDLVSVTSVIQHHQHPPAGQQTPAQAGLRGQICRNPSGRNLQGVKETADRLARRHRLL
jgi:hypothetical protein